MLGFDRRKRRAVLVLAAVALVVIVLNFSTLSGSDVRETISNIPIPELIGNSKPPSPDLELHPDPDV